VRDAKQAIQEKLFNCVACFASLASLASTQPIKYKIFIPFSYVIYDIHILEE